MTTPTQRKLLVVGGAAGLAIAMAFAGLLLWTQITTTETATGTTVQTKVPAPALALTLLDGRTLGPQNYRGRPMVVNFFASWCLPCAQEMPAIEAISREFGPKGVVFVGVAINDVESKVRQFVARHGMTFPAGLDVDSSIQKAFGLYGVPTTYFVDRHGIIQYFHSGAVTEELLRHELAKLL